MQYEIVDKDTVRVFDCKRRTFLVSIEDIEQVKRHTWYVSKVGYVERKDWRQGANVTVRLHRQILKDAPMVDHINGDRTDNRRSNLRPCNKSTNAANTNLAANNRTGYKGIVERKDYAFSRPTYRAYITVNHKRMCLGTFHDIESAGQARIEAEKKYFGAYRRCYENDKRGTC